MTTDTNRTPRRPLRQVQPVVAVLDDEHLPAPVRPLAAAWRKLDAREADAETSWQETRGKVAPAQAADRAAALEAAESGRSAPVPTDAHERQALADIDAAVLRLDQVRRDKQAAGRELLAAMVEHREQLEKIAAARAAKAAEQYAAALDKAERTLTQAAAALSRATESLGLLGELGREPRLRYEVGAPSWPVAHVDMAATRRDLKRISEAAEELTREPEPVEPVEHTHENTIGHVPRRKTVRA